MMLTKTRCGFCFAGHRVMLGWLAMMREDHGPATELLQEAQLLAQQAGDDRI